MNYKQRRKTMAKLKVVAEPGKHDIVMTREFNAPRELVFKAMIDPALIPKWWGPKKYTTIVDKMDVRMGGIWRYIQRDEKGIEYEFSGVFHDITSPERLVYTFEFEGTPSQVSLETVTLAEHDGKTIVTDSLIFQTVEDRNMMLQAGMEGGAAESWDNMDELLKTMQS
jgi:uncharacterized protein YndB with AHSA1/START domain